MLNQIFKCPQLWVSCVVGNLVRIKMPFNFHFLIKKIFIWYYQVDIKEMERPLEDYQTLGDFFIRRLKLGVRPIDKTKIVSPVDGVWTVFGKLNGEVVFSQIKGKNYSFSHFVNDQYLQKPFEEGFYTTIYLAPYHYHRVHSPIDGIVKSVTHIPGNLWPVNSWSVSHIDNLFAVNERIVVELETKEGYKCLLVMVGATNVGKMTLSFCEEIQGNSDQKKTRKLKLEKDIFLHRGDDLGCFHMGSTVIIIFDKQFKEHFLKSNTSKFKSCDVKMGQSLEF